MRSPWRIQTRRRSFPDENAVASNWSFRTHETILAQILVRLFAHVPLHEFLRNLETVAAFVLVGVLIFGIIQTAITFQGTLSSWWTKIVVGLLLLAFILLQKLIQEKTK